MVKVNGEGENISLFTETGCRHGGVRVGSGRKKTANPRKAHSFSCTDTEYKKLKAYLEELRKK